LSRKRTIVYGNVYNFGAAVLWVYARINFLWESEGKKWQQKELASMCNVSKSTLGQKVSKLIDSLKTYPLDQRFARKEMVEKDPLANLSIDPGSRMILPVDDMFGGIPIVKSKNDYYYDAMDYLNFGDYNKAIRLLRKALEIDEHYVEVLFGIAHVYECKGNAKKVREYANKAFEQTKKMFPKWPKEMSWYATENRQYMRAIHLKACHLWEENKIQEAEKLFRLLLKLNPGDNQGIRYLIAGMLEGLTGEDIDEMTDKGNEEQNWDALEELVESQNKIHKFWIQPKYN